MGLLTFTDLPQYVENLVLDLHGKERHPPELSPDDAAFAELRELCKTLEFMSEKYRVVTWINGIQPSISQRRIILLSLVVTNDPDSQLPLQVLVMANVACSRLKVPFVWDRQLMTYTAGYGKAVELAFYRKYP